MTTDSATTATPEGVANHAPAIDGILLTDAAAGKVRTLLQQEGRDDLALRVAVQPGGCSGLRYQLFFDERTLDGDVVTDFDGVGVVVDRMSVPYLNGAMIDFVGGLVEDGEEISHGKVPSVQLRCNEV